MDVKIIRLAKLRMLRTAKPSAKLVPIIERGKIKLRVARRKRK